MGVHRIYYLCLIGLISACGGSNEPIQPSTRGFDAVVQSILLADDGSGDIYVSGDFSRYSGSNKGGIARLNSDLSIDNNFVSDNGFNGPVLTLAIAADGSGDIYAGGDFNEFDGTTRNNIALLNSDGSLDATFNPGAGTNSPVLAIAPIRDGSASFVEDDIYVAGDFTRYGNGVADLESVVRVNRDGSVGGLDSVNGANAAILTLALANGSNNVYMGGAFTSYTAFNSGTSPTVERITQIGTSGVINDAFDTENGFNNTVRAIAVAPTGDIYIGGDFTSYDGVARNRIARLNSDGTLDTNFSAGSGFDAPVHTIALATDGSGDIYVGGEFTVYRLNPRNGIARVNIDSSNDADFDPGDGFNGTVFVIEAADNGSGDIYVGGNFTSYQSEEANRIIRLDVTGAAY